MWLKRLGNSLAYFGIAATVLAVPAGIPGGVARVSAHWAAATTPVAGCVSLPSGYTIYTPWDSAGGPSSNGYVEDGGYAYGAGDHVGCNNSSSENDYYAVDYMLKYGDNVYPTTGGLVQYAGPATGGWCHLGNIVYVTFTQGLSAIYAHLSQIYVSQGQSVTAGTALGAAGNSVTGSSCGSTTTHLHTAIYQSANFQYGPYGPYGGASVVPEPIKALVHGNVCSTQYVGEWMWD